ncbi:MAG: nucleotidyltransferase [Capnocytophaga felis]|nr:nucleotidyltransferase [Capnocytophaga felis]
MARTINEIQEQIYQAKESESALSELNSTSKTAIWRLLIYIVSVAIWTLEKIFDQHKKEVDERLSELKPHTARWYRNKALAFQYGFDLKEDSDIFDNKGNSEEAIANSKIVKYSAVIEKETGQLIVKIATEQGGKLQPISQTQQQAFEAYIAEIKDAGVRVAVTNYLPDRLVLNLQVYYDPLVLDENGVHRNNGNKPVEDAINQYMKELPFNGEMILAHLTDKLQQVEGVKIPNLIQARSTWIEPDSGGYGTAQPISVSIIPESGYFEVSFDNQEFKSNIKYIAK